MRVVLQRVREARVRIEGSVVGQVGEGVLLLVGFTDGDTPTESAWMADKIVGLRIFPDEEGRMNRSLEETGGAALVVSQFTLYGDTRKGRRPSFVRAAHPDQAVPLYEDFVAKLHVRMPDRVQTGRFGAMMDVELINDGPVTLILDRDAPDG